MITRSTRRQHTLPSQTIDEWNDAKRTARDDLVNHARDTIATSSSTTHATPPSDHRLRTWQDLLCDVEARLTLTRDAALNPISMHGSATPSNRLGSSAQECITAVNLLYMTLMDERDRRCQLEQALYAANSELVQVRTDLLSTRAEELRARHLATHDDLTGLPNCKFLHQRLTQALAHAATVSESLAVMYFDLDDFKSVNNTYGHPIGDALLTIVAARLARAMRAEDMVGRLGGDEFACLLLGIPDRDHLARLASKLLDAVSARCRVGNHKIFVHPSIGIAMYPADGATASTLLCHADTAMYAAKREQCGVVFFDRLTPASSPMDQYG
jgi:diguanylate cyclase